MSAEQLFSLCNLVALAGWILLIAAPRNIRALTIAGTVVPGVLSSLYLFLLAFNAADARGGFSSLAAVAELFSVQWLLLAGWVHYLAFDLFVGTWETRDAVERGVPRWILAPCLLLTFLFGPIGWLAYQAARRTRARA
jgi:thiosulfate reductase cytochrome b subunit